MLSDRHPSPYLEGATPMPRPCRLAFALLAGLISAGCGAPNRAVVYNPYVENDGDPTLGKQVEGVMDDLMKAVEHIDTRIENTLY